MLDTAETTYGPMVARAGSILSPNRHAEYALVMRRQNAAEITARREQLPEKAHEPVSGDVVGAPVPVYVNYGRWVVDCPGEGCGGAQMASRDDHRFFCVTCGNAFVGGRWLATVWPNDRTVAAIDSALEKRPLRFQNWTDEPVAVLLADNADPVNGL